MMIGMIHIKKSINFIQNLYNIFILHLYEKTNIQLQSQIQELTI